MCRFWAQLKKIWRHHKVTNFAKIARDNNHTLCKLKWKTKWKEHVWRSISPQACLLITKIKKMLMHSYVHPQIALNYRGYISIKAALHNSGHVNVKETFQHWWKGLFSCVCYVFCLLLSEKPVTARSTDRCPWRHLMRGSRHSKEPLASF